MKTALCLVLLLYNVHAASAAFHSLKYYFTTITRSTYSPEFSVVGLVDDEPFIYYDSNIRRKIPKTEWIKENEGADYWDRETQISRENQELFKNHLRTAMLRFNQTEGVHTLQYMYGCEWDDESGDTGGFRQLAFDGEDVLVYDLKNERFIAVAPQAFITAHTLNGNPAFLEYQKHYLTQICVEWLKKYWSYGRSTLERTVTPEVFLLQKEPSSPITCFATGFYPRAVVVMWQKNGWDLYEHTELGEILPNMDGTYQIRSRLTVGPEEWKSNEYTCTVMHKSLEQDIVLSVREENIRSNRKNKNGMYIIIGYVLGALTLALAIGIGVGVWIWKKRSGYRETSIADPDSGNSSPPAVELSPQ